MKRGLRLIKDNRNANEAEKLVFLLTLSLGFAIWLSSWGKGQTFYNYLIYVLIFESLFLICLPFDFGLLGVIFRSTKCYRKLFTYVNKWFTISKEYYAFCYH